MPLTARIRPARSAAPPRAPGRRRRGRPRARRASTSAHARPAVRAGVRLGVEAAVARVVVLGPARGAHGEAGHRRQRPVVRDAAHDREPRAAVGAVDERVAVAAVGGVERARRGTRRTSRCRARRARPASPPRALSTMRKPGSPPRRDRARARPPRPSRAAAPRAAGARGSARPPPASPSTSSTTPRSSLRDEAVEPERLGEAEDVRPEADALHRAVDARADARVSPPGLLRPGADLGEDEPVQQVVGGERGALDRPLLLGLLEPEHRREAQLEADPDEQPVGRARPRPAPDLLRQHRVRRAADGAVASSGRARSPRAAGRAAPAAAAPSRAAWRSPAAASGRRARRRP